MPFRKLKRVEVEWQDAAYSNAYFDCKDKNMDEGFSHGLVKCRTVGFLLTRKNNRVLLAAEQYEDGKERHTHAIPAGCIKSLKYLKEE